MLSDYERSMMRKMCGELADALDLEDQKRQFELRDAMNKLERGSYSKAIQRINAGEDPADLWRKKGRKKLPLVAPVQFHLVTYPGPLYIIERTVSLSQDQDAHTDPKVKCKSIALRTTNYEGAVMALKQLRELELVD